MTPASRTILVITLGMLATIGPLSIDMYLPALPAIQADLRVAAADVQLTLSSFLIGFALGQLLYGPLSDRFGRKPVLLSGVVLYALASLLCALSVNIEMLIAVRFFHAVGGGAGIVLARAIVRDYFPARETARLISLMAIITLCGPLVSPIIGGHLLVWTGWRSIFWLLTALALIYIFIVAFAVRESHPQEKRHPLNIVTTFKAYFEILRNRQALGYIACAAAGSGATFVYLISSPFVIIDIYKVKPDNFGYLHGIVVSGLIIAALMNSRMVMRYGLDRMIVAGLVIRVIGAVLLLSLVMFNIGGLPGFIFAVFLCSSPNALIFANVSAALTDVFPRLIGTSSSVLGACMIATGAAMGPLLGIMYDGTIMPMAILTFGLSLIGIAAYWLIIRLPRLEVSRHHATPPGE